MYRLIAVLMHNFVVNISLKQINIFERQEIVDC